MGSEYEDLADEYYDERAHPTIALLRAGSWAALLAFGPALLGQGTLFAEIGSGRGMLHHVALGRQVVSFDLNPGMLKAVPGLGIIADATALPVIDVTFDGAFASLCDPYNTADFLAEARRVLKPAAGLLMTVPNHTWVRHNQSREGVVDAAVVVSLIGPVVVPSFVHDPHTQVDLLLAHGFETVDVLHVALADVVQSTGITSPRFLDDAGNPVSPFVVDAYLAR